MANSVIWRQVSPCAQTEASTFFASARDGFATLGTQGDSKPRLNCAIGHALACEKLRQGNNTAEKSAAGPGKNIFPPHARACHAAHISPGFTPSRTGNFPRRHCRRPLARAFEHGAQLLPVGRGKRQPACQACAAHQANWRKQQIYPDTSMLTPFADKFMRSGNFAPGFEKAVLPYCKRYNMWFDAYTQQRTTIHNSSSASWRKMTAARCWKPKTWCSAAGLCHASGIRN